MRRALGLTLVELLVAVSIIAIVLVVSLPAVLHSREASRRSQCAANTHQIALACHHYCDANKVYPPGQFLGPYGKGPDSTAWSFLARILTLIEEKSVYSQGGIPRKTLRASKVADKSISLFLCPSDGHRTAGPRYDSGDMKQYLFSVGQTNYKGVSGANWGADESQSWGPKDSGTKWPNIGTNGSYDGLAHGDGMFYRSDYLIRRRPLHVKDGLSKTLMIGEALPSKDHYCSWPYANNAYSTCAIPPNFDEPDPVFWPNAQSFRSAHPGGLHFASADCSVHFINDSIDLQVYRALATIDGHESADVK